MENNKKTALIIFAREPELGKVKTRLQEQLSASQVLRLYKAFIRDILSIVKNVGCTEKLIYYKGAGASIPFLRGNSKGFTLRRQAGGDLGQRMRGAFDSCFKRGFEKVIIIGADCLTVTERDINRAFQQLDKFDSVLGPANDGGYYLIGLSRLENTGRRKAPGAYIQKALENIDWGTDKAFGQTLRNLKKRKKSVYLLPKKEDIDTIVELKHFAKDKKDLKSAQNTAKEIKTLAF